MGAALTDAGLEGSGRVCADGGRGCFTASSALAWGDQRGSATCYKLCKDAGLVCAQGETRPASTQPKVVVGDFLPTCETLEHFPYFGYEKMCCSSSQEF